MATVSFPTDKAIEEIIGDIKGFDLEPGGFYEHVDGDAHIDGTEMLNSLLSEIPGVEKAVVTPELTEVTIPVEAIKVFMEQSGFRAMDYDDAAAAEEFGTDPIGVINSMRVQFGVKVDPHDFIVSQDEDWTLEADEEARVPIPPQKRMRPKIAPTRRPLRKQPVQKEPPHVKDVHTITEEELPEDLMWYIEQSKQANDITRRDAAAMWNYLFNADDKDAWVKAFGENHLHCLVATLQSLRVRGLRPTASEALFNEALNLEARFNFQGPTLNFVELGIPRDFMAQLLSSAPLQGDYRMTNDMVFFETPDDMDRIKSMVATQ